MKAKSVAGAGSETAGPSGRERTSGRAWASRRTQCVCVGGGAAGEANEAPNSRSIAALDAAIAPTPRSSGGRRRLLEWSSRRPWDGWLKRRPRKEPKAPRTVTCGRSRVWRWRHCRHNEQHMQVHKEETAPPSPRPGGIGCNASVGVSVSSQMVPVHIRVSGGRGVCLDRIGQ